MIVLHKINNNYYYTIPIFHTGEGYFIENFDGNKIDIKKFILDNNFLIHYFIVKDRTSGETLKAQDNAVYYTKTTKTPGLRKKFISYLKPNNLINSNEFIVINLTVKPEYKTAIDLSNILRLDSKISDYKLKKNILTTYTINNPEEGEILYKQYIIEPTGELTEI